MRLIGTRERVPFRCSQVAHPKFPTPTTRVPRPSSARAGRAAGSPASRCLPHISPSAYPQNHFGCPIHARPFRAWVGVPGELARWGECMRVAIRSRTPPAPPFPVPCSLFPASPKRTPPAQSPPSKPPPLHSHPQYAVILSEVWRTLRQTQSKSLS